MARAPVLWWKYFCRTAIWLIPTWWPRWQQVVPVGATNADVVVVEARKIAAIHAAVTLDRDDGDALEVSPVRRLASLTERQVGPFRAPTSPAKGRLRLTRRGPKQMTATGARSIDDTHPGLQCGASRGD